MARDAAGGVGDFETGRRSSGMLVVTRPSTTNGGKGVHAAVQKPGDPRPNATLTGRYERLTITQ